MLVQTILKTLINNLLGHTVISMPDREQEHILVRLQLTTLKHIQSNIQRYTLVLMMLSILETIQETSIKVILKIM